LSLSLVSLACGVSNVLNPAPEMVTLPRFCNDTLYLTSYSVSCSSGEPPVSNIFQGFITNLGEDEVLEASITMTIVSGKTTIYCPVQVSNLPPQEGYPFSCTFSDQECHSDLKIDESSMTTIETCRIDDDQESTVREESKVTLQEPNIPEVKNTPATIQESPSADNIQLDAEGNFTTIVNEWEFVQNEITLHFNSEGGPVTGEATKNMIRVDEEYTITSLQSIEINGMYDAGSSSFEGTAWVKSSYVCTGQTECSEPFDYPASWWAFSENDSIQGNIDGLGDFELAIK